MTTPKAEFAGLAPIAALSAGVTLGLTAPPWAQYVTTDTIRRFCSGEGAETPAGKYIELSICEGYVRGIFEFHDFAYVAKGSPMFCVPPETS